MNKLNENFVKLYLRWKSGDNRFEDKSDNIKKFLRDYHINSSDIVINKYDVDFNCDVNISDLNDLNFKIGHVHGDFDSSSLGLKTMKYFPRIVDGNFDISDNYLKNFDGCPEEIGGDFTAIDCHSLESLSGLPKLIGGNFLLTGTDFTEEDIPETTTIKGSINFSIRRRRRG